MLCMKKMMTCLWFDNQGEAAIDYYLSVFKNSNLTSKSRNGKGGPGPENQMLAGTVELEDMQLMVLNGGPHYTLSPAVSLYINCADQQEVDYYWDKLGDGGKYMQCGWLTDRFGVSWQVVPTILPELLQDKDKEKSQRVMKAMMQMI